MNQFNPFLPKPESSMDYRDLRQYRQNQGAAFFETAMKYANFLWYNGLPARAILAMDRALFTNLKELDKKWQSLELPYSALIWFLKNPQKDKFLGNPRVHYQHLADRVRGERKEIKQWRTWACWYLTCKAIPELEPDVSHVFIEPTLDTLKNNSDQLSLYLYKNQPSYD